jgi:putative tricarboxylic transport membrane protein
MAERPVHRVTLRTDHIAGGAAIILGLVVLALSGDLPLGSLSFPGAGLWPKLICALMIVLGVLLCARAGASNPVAQIDWSDLPHAAIVTAATAAAIALYPTLGFIVAIGLLLAGLALLERRKPLFAVIYGAGISVAVYALFTVLLKSPLERGLIGF